MKIFLSLFTTLAILSGVTSAAAAPMNVASFNLRMNTSNDGPNAWPARK